MADNLKKKTLSGVIWSSIHKIAIMLLGFISGIVLARLLTPHDYGVIGMLTIFLAVSQTFIDGGFGSALIQKKTPTSEDYSTILYWNLALSLFLYILLYACAPVVARFYNLSLLCDVLRVQGLVLIINAARIVQRNQLRKQLQFKKIAIINVSSNVIALAFTIYWAWKGWGVWALVAQQLLVSLLTTSLYWATAKWKPLLVFSKKSFMELFGFGGFILLSNLFNTLCNNIQPLLIGKVYNSSTLGFYSKARSTESYASTFLSSVLSQVTYPVFSEAQNDKMRIISILKKIIGASSFITFPLMLLMILLAKPIFTLLYTEKWLPCVPYFQLLCIAGIAISLQNINYFAVAAIGKSKAIMKWTIVKRVSGLVLTIAGLWLFGIYGMIVGSVITSWLIYIINAMMVSKYIGYTNWQQLKDLMPILLSSSIAFILTYIVGFILPWSDSFIAIIQFIIYTTIYLTISILFKVEAYTFTKEILNILLNKFKRGRTSLS
ncbi:MAG: lipopolysaccharide biosynthesis protein [Prevotella sp.]|nr:lipopolysaccharide biosynthesis protein [Prevotella sp.]